MKRKIFRAIIVLLALIGIVLIVIRSLPITYNGLELPTPPQVAPDIVLPPAAWLIVDDKAVLASYGSSCTPTLVFGMGCGTMPEPWDRPDLVTVTLSAEKSAVIVIASTAIQEFHATVQPWAERSDSVPSTLHELKTERKRGINKTVYTLEPLDDASDMLLEVTVNYNRGSASYYWRLNPASTAQPAFSPFQAVYLVKHPGQLSLEDLQLHPEVAVTSDFDDFKQHAQTKVALWIDKNAIELLDQQWLREAPQKYYPLALVGYNEPLYAFREALPVAQIEGPAMDWSTMTLEPGFSVWMIRDETGSSLSAFMNGYNQMRSVQGILDITNALLEGRTK